jgi:toxin ParE1/3/4
MSSRKVYRLELSPKAEQDFVDILRYTAETWGEAQFALYRTKIDDALQALIGNPQLGHQRTDLPPTHLAYLVGGHVIVYRVRGATVAVLRILHQRMSLGKHI